MPANTFSRAWPAPTGARPKVFRTADKILLVLNRVVMDAAITHAVFCLMASIA